MKERSRRIIRKRNRRLVKQLADEGNRISLRVTMAPDKSGGHNHWEAFQTSEDGVEVQSWDLGGKPFPQPKVSITVTK